MLEHQRMGLTEAVGRILTEPGPHFWALELQRITWGATCEELIETLHNIDTAAALDYTARATDEKDVPFP